MLHNVHNSIILGLEYIINITALYAVYLMYTYLFV